MAEGALACVCSRPPAGAARARVRRGLRMAAKAALAVLHLHAVVKALEARVLAAQLVAQLAHQAAAAGLPARADARRQDRKGVRLGAKGYGSMTITFSGAGCKGTCDTGSLHSAQNVHRAWMHMCIEYVNSEIKDMRLQHT